MYKTVLVAKDVENGRRILDRLNREGWNVTAAFWFHSEEEGRWKLVIVSPDVSDKGPRLLYTMIQTMLSELAKDPKDPVEFALDQIMLVSPFSLLYKRVKQGAGLRVVVGGPLREGLNEDAYVYQMD